MPVPDDELGSMGVADLRVQKPDSTSDRTQSVSRDGGSANRERGGQSSHADERSAGAEELAVALAESERGQALTATYEIDANGEPLIRIVDQVRGETVALITPEELKTLAEDTGLPPGLLVRLSS